MVFSELNNGGAEDHQGERVKKYIYTINYLLWHNK